MQVLVLSVQGPNQVCEYNLASEEVRMKQLQIGKYEKRGK